MPDRLPVPDIEPVKNGWSKFGYYILAEIKRQGGDITEIRMALQNIDKRITILEVKSGMWGAVGGIVGGGIVSYVVSMVMKGKV